MGHTGKISVSERNREFVSPPFTSRKNYTFDLVIKMFQETVFMLKKCFT